MTDHRIGQYGASFADVYDDWYSEPSSATTAETVDALVELAGPGPVLELGVGTGRLALPLAAHGIAVHGIDASAAMLDVLRAKPGSERLLVCDGDMSSDLPDGPFSLVFVAVNTFFNLTSEQAQRSCFARVAERLSGGGRFAVEAFVPTPAADTSKVEVRTLERDRVVLVASRTEGQLVEGQHIELVQGSPVRLRPWAIRWATTRQLDAMAASAGLDLENRWASWRGDRFCDDSSGHVSVYRKTRPSEGETDVNRETTRFSPRLHV